MFKNLSVLLLLVAFFQPVFAQKKEAEAVKKAFENYKSAILNDKGSEAVKFVDSRTIKYYQDVSDWVRNADSAKVESLSLLDKFMVFTTRHRSTREEQLVFNGKSLLIYAINNGMVGKNSVANNTIGEVTIEDNFAKAQLVSRGKPAPLYFHFYKEDKQWKLDLTALFALSSTGFKKMIEESEETENDFLFNMLEMITGKRPDATIWKPAQKD